MNTSVKHMGKDTTLTVRVECSVKERLEAVAKQLNRSKSYLASEAIEEFVAVQEWQIKGIEEAMKSLDAGEGVSHEEVVRWVSSWENDNELPNPK